MTPRFKVGDCVRLVNHPMGYFDTGMIKSVYNSTTDSIYVVYALDNGRDWWIDERFLIVHDAVYRRPQSPGNRRFAEPLPLP